MRNPSLRGHVALITGANHGIGAATAMTLAARAAEVVVSYLRISDPGDRGGPELYRTARAQGAEKVLAAIKEVGGRAISVEADLADARTAAHLFDSAEAAFGPVDILINNAHGLGSRHLFTSSARALWAPASPSVGRHD